MAPSAAHSIPLLFISLPPFIPLAGIRAQGLQFRRRIRPAQRRGPHHPRTGLPLSLSPLLSSLPSSLPPSPSPYLSPSPSPPPLSFSLAPFSLLSSPGSSASLSYKSAPPLLTNSRFHSPFRSNYSQVKLLNRQIMRWSNHSLVKSFAGQLIRWSNHSLVTVTSCARDRWL